MLELFKKMDKIIDDLIDLKGEVIKKQIELTNKVEEAKKNCTNCKYYKNENGKYVCNRFSIPLDIFDLKPCVFYGVKK